MRGQIAGGVQRQLKGLQVAVVDPHQRGFQHQRPVEFFAVMHFDQRIHAVMRGGILQLGGERVIDRGHDDQDAIGPPGAGLGHLIGVIEEILAQSGQGAGRAGGGQKLRRALKRRRIGEDREAGGPPGLIGLGEGGRVKIGADQTFRGAGLLDLGNQAIAPGGHFAAEGGGKATGGGGSAGLGLQPRQGARLFGGGDLFEFIGFDLVENIHARLLKLARRGRAKCRPCQAMRGFLGGFSWWSDGRGPAAQARWQQCGGAGQMAQVRRQTS